MRNPFGTTYGPSARQTYLNKGSERAQDAADRVQAAREIENEKQQKQIEAGKVNLAKHDVRKCNTAKHKMGKAKCGPVGSGVYCHKHRKQGVIITNGGG